MVIFNEHGLKINIEANKKCVDFLDVTFDWQTHALYQAKQHFFVYSYNHPPMILQNLAESIDKRLSHPTKNHSTELLPHTDEPL